MTHPAFLALAWVVALAAGLALTLFASTRTVEHTRDLVSSTRLPPFLIGITLLAVGTDLPEIANSLVASYTDHGDLNAGDSIGSTVTQATLVLGLLPMFAARFAVRPLAVLAVCIATIIGLGIGALAMRDGDLSQLDGGALVLTWVVGSVLLAKYLGGGEVPAAPESGGSRGKSALLVLGYLALVGIGSATVVTAFAEISVILGMPEYFLSFFLASIGTSLPELVVDVTALRAGHAGMAMGNTLGSCFVDSTLSIGIGPMLFPTAVTASLAVTGSLTAIVALGVIAAVLAATRAHGRVTGALFIALYLGVYFVMLS